MNSQMLMLGRQFLHGKTSTGECCSCGGELVDALPVNKTLKSSFTAFDAFIRGPSAMVCANCRQLLDVKELRFKTIISTEPGKIDAVKPAELYGAFIDPPDAFVVSVAYSHQKHHWLYAGLSGPTEILVGTDSRTVSYRPADHRMALDSIAEMIHYGVPARQIEAGVYHPSTYEKIGHTWLTEKEYVIESHRVTGLVELLLQIVPRPEKPDIRRIENMALQKDDALSAEYLAAIAKESQYRKERGKDFWGGVFLHRVNRAARRPGSPEVPGYWLSKITDELLAVLSVPEISAASRVVPLLKDYTPEEMGRIEKALKERAKLIVSIAYSILKEEKEADGK